MTVRVYGFNWETYAQCVMPAFKLWLTQGDDSLIYPLYTQTRCFREEQFLPPAIQPLRTWSRAHTFVQQLPQGSHTRREYEVLCSAEEFTELSDSYVHRHPPQLYQNTDALRAVWGATVAEHCLACFHFPLLHTSSPMDPELYQQQEHSYGDIVSLLQSAGLHELAWQVHQQSLEGSDNMPATEEEGEDGDTPEIHGMEIGRHPATLHLRGWLASLSIRSMALFELLACGRRRLPFGYRTGEPYEDFVGYLTPREVWQLSRCLRYVQAPSSEETRASYAFLCQSSTEERPFHMIDEVLPEHAENLLAITHQAAQHGLGLLCSS
ncbi:hypothetical protein [Dictyobacter aurantiacus]|uniref:Uncharacterized protein n=1 Tax=Dictyobacter aurantiacus TaxID=1936993 RepID=A0A401ZHJ9_9CHLR|nr:hypothetical protein [Dictyobacter aurantiacus]GCE06316.1 hypothetical protein KDAU_36450 [Dictyobacter aurantiacus]